MKKKVLAVVMSGLTLCFGIIGCLLSTYSLTYLSEDVYFSSYDIEVEKYGCHLIGEYEYPFNIMSQDWCEDDVYGFVYHDIADDCRENGGEFPVIAQIYSYILCKGYSVDYEILFSLVEYMSGACWDYRNGDLLGYLALNRNTKIEDKMEIYSNIENPFINLMVGIFYLSDLYNSYGRWDIVLKYFPIPEDDISIVLERADILKKESLKYR